jgi:hypothetical protein
MKSCRIKNIKINEITIIKEKTCPDKVTFSEHFFVNFKIKFFFTKAKLKSLVQCSRSILVGIIILELRVILKKN